MKHSFTCIYLLFFAFPTGVAFAGDWSFSMGGQVTYAQVDGFQQTPRGGQIGSTSLKRPSFDEIGIKNHTNFQLTAQVNYDSFLMAFHFIPSHLNGDTQLSSNLITHNILLSAGTYFKAKVNDELYNLQFGYVFELCSRWHLTPKLNFYWWEHDYHFSSPAISSFRRFSASGLGIGLQSDWQFNPKWEIQTIVNLGVPLTNLNIYHAKLGLGYLISLSNIIIKPQIFIEGLDVRFKDNQTVPNYLKYSAFPTIGLSMNVQFH